jgi:hypothetical protein
MKLARQAAVAATAIGVLVPAASAVADVFPPGGTKGLDRGEVAGREHVPVRNR